MLFIRNLGLTFVYVFMYIPESCGFSVNLKIRVVLCGRFFVLLILDGLMVIIFKYILVHSYAVDFLCLEGSFA